MRLSVVTALSALAVASQALLVPLESYAAEESKAFSALIAGGSIPLVFPCPGCPLQTIDENGVEGWSKDVKNSLVSIIYHFNHCSHSPDSPSSRRSPSFD